MFRKQSGDASQLSTYISLGSKEDYIFPDARLKRTMDDPGKIPLLLVACGSFSPVTYLHLRIFEAAADYVRLSTNFELLGGYLSPGLEVYHTAGFVSARHRACMCQLAVDQASDWLMVDTWELKMKKPQPTGFVLDHFDYEINTIRKGVHFGNGSRKPVRIILLAGANSLHAMVTRDPGSKQDMDHLLRKYGIFVVERNGTDIAELLADLQPWKGNIYVIQQLIHNNVSGAKIRYILGRQMSARYLIPGPVIHYIAEHHLYECDGIVAENDKTKVDVRNQGNCGMSEEAVLQVLP